uniref:Uncharacterized protein n=1 Tax=Haptolina brevifila TaxID=156173 RepID=A0A7S2DHI2_9EUKA|mmetsp:Transcript_38513/g.77131  ORF Transcript_38513/g.77131 Transcript_38513/m.77131 type:complete len:375 (+) Transcript_38513:3-1127(+)
MLAGWMGGGTALGSLDASSCSLTDRVEAHPPSSSVGHEAWPPVWAVSQNGVPGDDHLRGLGTLVSFSSNFREDGVVFGASAFAVMVSRDRGATWDTILQHKQTTSQCSAPSGCALCRFTGTYEQQFSSWRTNAESDVGAYCIECEECYTRLTTNGACVKQRGCVVSSPPPVLPPPSPAQPPAPPPPRLPQPPTPCTPQAPALPPPRPPQPSTPLPPYAPQPLTPALIGLVATGKIRESFEVAEAELKDSFDAAPLAVSLMVVVTVLAFFSALAFCVLRFVRCLQYKLLEDSETPQSGNETITELHASSLAHGMSKAGQLSGACNEANSSEPSSIKATASRCRNSAKKVLMQLRQRNRVRVKFSRPARSKRGVGV